MRPNNFPRIKKNFPLTNKDVILDQRLLKIRKVHSNINGWTQEIIVSHHFWETFPFEQPFAYNLWPVVATWS